MDEKNSDNLLIDARALSKQMQSPDGQTLSILKGVDLQVKPGEVVAILGASGSGKSTLLGLLAGLDECSSGEIYLLGKAMHDLDEDARAALRLGRVGFVFQSFQLMPGMSALENVSLPLQLKAKEIKLADPLIQAKRLLRDVGLAERMHHLPQQLSGGEQQRVALARAFAGPPKILFADEPTGNLDTATGEKIADLLFGLRDRYATTLILVTHDKKLAERCDRIVRLHEGSMQ
jgi:putative ABC transport system ATP-binding protein